METDSGFHNQLSAKWYDKSLAKSFTQKELIWFDEKKFMREEAHHIFKQVRFFSFCASVGHKQMNVLLHAYWAQLRVVFTRYAYLSEDDFSDFCKVPAINFGYNNVPVPTDPKSKQYKKFAVRMNNFDLAEWWSKEAKRWEFRMTELATTGLFCIYNGYRSSASKTNQRRNVKLFNKAAATQLAYGGRLQIVQRRVEGVNRYAPKLNPTGRKIYQLPIELHEKRENDD